jgi:hypothetical protein
LINDCASSDGVLVGVNQIARQASNLGKIDSGIGNEPINAALNEFYDPGPIVELLLALIRIN